MGKKIFVSRLPQEASVEDLHMYFGRFGRILDVYVPKDPKRSGHRGFGFVTFSEDGVADLVSRRSHEICGQQVAIDSATTVDDGGSNGGSFMDNPEPPSYAGYGPMRAYGRMYGSLDFDDVEKVKETMEKMREEHEKTKSETEEREERLRKEVEDSKAATEEVRREMNEMNEKWAEILKRLPNPHA